MTELPRAARVVVPVVFLACLCGTGAAQRAPTTSIVERYTRAAAIQAHRRDRWILNNAIVPHWIAGTDQVWYRRETVDGYRYVLVDAHTGAKTDLFDHAKLAELLGRETGKSIAPSGLNLGGVHIDPDRALRFQFGAKWWRFTPAGTLAALVEPAGGAVVSPDGKLSVMLKSGNLWIRDFSTGAERAITTDAEPLYRYADLPDATGRHGSAPFAIWSPDSRKLLTIQTDDRKTGELPVIDYAPAGSLRPTVIMHRVTLPGDVAATSFRILVIDVATGHQIPARYQLLPVTRMMDTPVDGGRAWWSADSRTAYFIDLERGEQAAHVVRFDPETGHCDVVMTETTDTFLELGYDVYAPVAVRYLPASNQLLWYSERTGWAHLYLYDLGTGQLIRPLTSGAWRVRDVLAVDEKRRQAFITVAGRTAGKNPYQREIARVDLDHGGITPLSDQEGDHAPVVPGSTVGSLEAFYELLSGGDANAITAFSPSYDYFVETITAPNRASETVLEDRGGKLVSVLETADVSRMPAWWRWPEPMTFTAADGTTELRGLLFRPSSFDPSRKYPIIDFVYGGPQTAATPQGFGQGWYLDAASLAELGFVVLIVDGRGTSGRDRAFMNASYGRIQNASFDEDHIEAIKQVGRRYRYADTTRVGTHGFSGGGFMAARLMLGHPEFYQVGVAGDGNYDQRLFYSTWGERYHGLLSPTKTYEDQDLTRLAGNLRGKLLLYHGGVDFGVNPAAMFRLIQALMDANKDFDLLMYPRLAHQTPGYGLRRNWDYFVRYLGREEPPREFKVKSEAEYRQDESSQ